MELNEQVQSKLEQLAKLPSAARIGVSVGIAALVLAVYFFGIYRDGSQRLDKLRTQEQELQVRLSEVRSIAANLAAFEQEIEALESQLQEVLLQLPNEKELETLLTDISNLGKKAGVEMKSFQRKNEVSQGFYAEVPLAIELEGQYHDIARFFDLLSKLPRIVNMGALKMTVASENLDRTVLKVQGTATTFRFTGKDEKV